MGGSGRALRDAHLSDDKTVAKMGHPISQGQDNFGGGDELAGVALGVVGAVD
jgi:hypothetical protein